MADELNMEDLAGLSNQPMPNLTQTPQLDPRAKKMQSIKGLLGNLTFQLAEGLQGKDAGDAFARTLAAPYKQKQMDLELQQAQQQIASQKSLEAYRNNELAMQQRRLDAAKQTILVTTPDGRQMQVPMKLAEKLFPAQVKANSAKEVAGINNDARATEGDKNRDNKLEIAKLNASAAWQRLLKSEDGKNHRQVNSPSNRGSFSPFTDANGNIVGFFNTKDPSVIVRAPENITMRKGAVPAETNKTVANAQNGLKAIADIRAEVQKDPQILLRASTPLMERKFRAMRNEAIDVLSRLRTGAAINEQEEKFYKDQLPGALDYADPAAVEYKLSLFETLFNKLGSQGSAPSQNRQKLDGIVNDGKNKKVDPLGLR